MRIKTYQDIALYLNSQIWACVKEPVPTETPAGLYLLVCGLQSASQGGGLWTQDGQDFQLTGSKIFQTQHEDIWDLENIIKTWSHAV